VQENYIDKTTAVKTKLKRTKRAKIVMSQPWQCSRYSNFAIKAVLYPCRNFSHSK